MRNSLFQTSSATHMATLKLQEENPSLGVEASKTTAMSLPRIPSDIVFGSTTLNQLQSSVKSPFGFLSSMATFSNGQDMHSNSHFLMASPFRTTTNSSSGASTRLFAKLPPILPRMGQSETLTPVFDFKTIHSVGGVFKTQHSERVLAINKAATEQDGVESLPCNNNMSKKAAARARAANSSLDFLADVLDTLDLVKTPEEVRRERKRIIDEDMRERKQLRMKLKTERNTAKKAVKAGLDAEKAAEMAFSLLSLNSQEKHPILTRREKHLQRREHLRQKAIQRERKRALWRPLVEEIEEFPAVLPLSHIRDMKGLDLVRALLLSHNPNPTEDDGYRESMICFKRAFHEETINGHKYTLLDVLQVLLPSIKEKYVCFVACRGVDPRDMTKDQKHIYAMTASRIGVVRQRDRQRADAACKQMNTIPVDGITEKIIKLNGDPGPRPARKTKRAKRVKGKKVEERRKRKKRDKTKDKKTRVNLPSIHTERRIKLKKARQNDKRDIVSGKDVSVSSEIDTSVDVDVIGNMVAEY
ncbi:hypothetical protein BGZ60DRAFT_393210 [Tricladium varicosporioides]|nr:hypothetical protein BGZ60DRAFT_393210 [Hymenoscyphus varicosporioides]